jgi:MoaA/NifB/PqqE/SkfB family radical SAM enzyme
MNRFEDKLAQHGLALHHARLQTLQINVGRKCNQACRHCHVDAGSRGECEAYHPIVATLPADKLSG